MRALYYLHTRCLILTVHTLFALTDTFQGSWCQNERNCRDLANCIQGEINEVGAMNERPAFLRYLEGAPQLIKPEEGVDETDDPTRCSSLREYFSYDPDYADDTRICREVKELKVRYSCVFYSHRMLLSI